jgi:hypothetical protein
MSSIIGSVSLTNGTGVFLGEVNISNLNATSNEVLYTPDGASITGNTNLKYNPSTNTLSTTNILGTNLTITNINGSAYPPSSTGGVTVNSQSTNALVSCTSTSNTLQGNSTLTYDGTKLQLGSIYLYPTSTSISLTDSASAMPNNSVAVGYKAYAGSASTTIGYNSGKASSGGYNCILGSFCGSAITSGNGNCIVGANTALALTSGTNNTFLGVSTGGTTTTQSNNTVVGYYNVATDTSSVARTNCSILGANIRGVLSGDNQVQIGDSSTTVYTYATATRSDARDKADIQDTTLGLEFINDIKPRMFRWDYRDDYKEDVIDENQNITTTILPKDGSKKRTRLHQGVIAQEVKETMEKLGIDFPGYQDSTIKGGTDVLHINYTEFIAPLIKAIQELTARVQALESK